MYKRIEITGPSGELREPDWLARAETVHRQLRPQLPPDYAAAMAKVFSGGGRMILAARNETVLGVAVYRVFANTFCGRVLYVDDLVTDERARSSGVGKALLGWCEAIARAEQCQSLSLDSGTQRHRAHAFYLRERMKITSFHFDKTLD